VAGFECGNVVLDHTAKPHDFNRVGAQRFLMMIAQSYEKEQTGQKCNDDNSHGGAGQELEVKMLRAKKPRSTSSKNASANLRL
jgi:hypothetical protein